MDQFYLYTPVFAITIRVLRRVADNILIAQLDADLLRDVRELVQVLDREVPAPVCSEISLNRLGPPSSSAVRPRDEVGSKMPIA